MRGHAVALRWPYLDVETIKKDPGIIAGAKLGVLAGRVFPGFVRMLCPHLRLSRYVCFRTTLGKYLRNKRERIIHYLLWIKP